MKLRLPGGIKVPPEIVEWILIVLISHFLSGIGLQVNNAADSAIVFGYKAASDKELVSKDNKDSGLSMEEIDRKIDEMPVFDLRDPKVRKQTNINIDEIIEHLNLEVLMATQTADDVKNIDTDGADVRDED